MRALPRGVLDSDVIFSRVLHELMGRAAADARLLDLVWSDELLDEAKNTLIKLKPLQPHVAEAWVGHMRREFPTGKADTSEIPDRRVSTFQRSPRTRRSARVRSRNRRGGGLAVHL